MFGKPIRIPEILCNGIANKNETMMLNCSTNSCGKEKYHC